MRALLSSLVDAGKGAQTVQVVRRLVSRVLAQAVDDGLIAANPATRIASPKVERKPIRILTVDEVETLADAIDRRYRAAVLLGAYGGLRFGEVAALRRPSLRLLEPAPTFHHLRHTAAALAIAEGAHPKAIQSRLGHAKITTTLDLYGHLFPALDEDLATRLGEARAARLRHAGATNVVALGSPRA